jgi:hypothetical protein
VKSNSFAMFACLKVNLPAWNKSAPWVIFMEFYILKKPLRKLSFFKILARITGTYREHVFTFTKISRSVLLRMRTISHTHVAEKIKKMF